MDNRTMLQEEFSVGEGSVSVRVNINNIPQKEEDQIKKATNGFLNLVSAILQGTPAVSDSAQQHESSINWALDYAIEHDKKKHLVKFFPCTEKQDIVLKEKDVLVFIQSLLECVTGRG